MTQYKKETTPEDLRAILVSSIRMVIEGDMSVQQANAISSLSSEVHKSIKMEYVGQILSRETITVKNGKVINVLGE